MVWWDDGLQGAVEALMCSLMSWCDALVGRTEDAGLPPVVYGDTLEGVALKELLATACARKSFVAWSEHPMVFTNQQPAAWTRVDHTLTEQRCHNAFQLQAHATGSRNVEHRRIREPVSSWMPSPSHYLGP